MNVEELKAQLNSIEKQMLDEIVGPAAQIEDAFERIFLRVQTLTYGTYDAGGNINEALRELSEGRAQAGDLCGYENRVILALQSYTQNL
ncbi:hypothetical protein REH65_31390 [Saccharopolyspora sp. ID03-671]|uniref:hypothetical protein n=1 Tax=Saccharopolyspora sp. ID03-671 TaxID=3073066 RepID=UPI0032488F3C